MKNDKYENFLDDIVCRIIECWENFNWDSKNEIEFKFCDYVFGISPIRKVINFSFKSWDFDHKKAKKIGGVSDNFTMFDLNEKELREKIDKLVKNVIYKENKYIADFLIDYADENNFIKNIGEDTIDEMINFLIDVPEAVIIADKNLKKLITNNKLYKNNSDVINKNNICFLDEVENCIIQLDFRLGSFNIFNPEAVGVGSNELDYWFTMYDSMDLFFQDPFGKFISVYKNRS